MGMVKVRGLAVESAAPMLFFEGPFRDADVGLTGGLAFLERIHGDAPDFSIGGGWREVGGRSKDSQLVIRPT
jgi:hypothetical protein